MKDDALERYRDAMVAYELTITPLGKERVWTILSDHIRPTTAPIPIYNLRWFRIAASVLLTATLGLALWFVVPRTSLLASTDESMAFVTLDDGSTIRLRPDSELRSFSRGWHTRYHLIGEAWFDIAPQSSGSFVVETASASVAVLGTQFVFGERDGGARVVLIEGRVRFSAADQLSASVLLAPGQSSAIGKDGVPTPPAPTDIQAETSWTSGLLQLNAMPLSDIVNALVVHFQVELIFPDSWASERIGGSLSLESLNQSLDELNRLLPAGIEVRRK